MKHFIMSIKTFNKILILCWLFALPSHAKELVIENVTLISPERAKPMLNANIRIVDGTIREVSISKITSTESTETINGKGKFLIPGLMDSHVHVSQMPGMLFEPHEPKLKKLVEQFLLQQPKSYLYFGVTQLLDPSQSKNSIQIFNSSENKPDLFHCGAVPILQGYPAIFAGTEAAARMFSYFVIDDQLATPLPEHINPQEHTPERVVERIFQDGAICIKLFIEDGFGSASHWPLIRKELSIRLIKAAREKGMIVMAHANAIDMQEHALSLDIDVIAHGLWNWNELDGQKELPARIRRLLDRVTSQSTIFQSTFNVMDGLKNLTVPNILQDPLYQKVVSEDALAWYQTEQGLWFRDEMLKDSGNAPLERIHQRHDLIISQGERATQYLYQSGLPMVLASDTPSSPTFAAQPGLSTYQELQHMAKIGIKLKDILSAATINNAKAFGLADIYGTIEPGKKANLVLLNSNPLVSISAYNQIDKIILNGRAIEREQLSVQKANTQEVL